MSVRFVSRVGHANTNSSRTSLYPAATLLLAASAVVFWAGPTVRADSAEKPSAPNLVFILADDKYAELNADPVRRPENGRFSSVTGHIGSCGRSPRVHGNSGQLTTYCYTHEHQPWGVREE